MELNSSQVENIVRKVLSEMNGSHECSCGGNCAHKSAELPKTAKVAMLTDKRKIEVKEFPVPAVGDNDILVKVEGCGVCGTDVHEWKGDPFGLIPVVLGHEGTGEVIAMGKNVHCDTAGKPLKVGDKIVTSVISCGECGICRLHPGTTNLCDNQGVFGLIGHNETNPLNGWFSTHLLISAKGATYFQVNDLNLKERMLLELATVCVHALSRGQGTGLINFGSKVLVQGCGPIGLICIAVLRTMGVENITAVDGEQKCLDFAKEMGANKSVNFKDHKGIENLAKAVEESFGGHPADFAFQCTGSPVAHSNIYKFIRNGGGLCELGFFINGGDATINPHFDICAKEITTVGSWVYTLRDYATTFDFLKRANGIGLPMSKLITHTYPLEEINEGHRTNLKMEGLKIAIINK